MRYGRVRFEKGDEARVLAKNGFVRVTLIRR